jgi:hypothetical protein
VDLYIHSPIRLHGIVLNSLSTGTALPYLTFTRGNFTFLQSIVTKQKMHKHEMEAKLMPLNTSCPLDGKSCCNIGLEYSANDRKKITEGVW